MQGNINLRLSLGGRRRARLEQRETAGMEKAREGLFGALPMDYDTEQAIDEDETGGSDIE